MPILLVARRGQGQALVVLGLAAALLGAPLQAAGQPAPASTPGARTGLGDLLQMRPGGVLGLMGYNMTPDGSANAMRIERGTTSGVSNTVLVLSQFGFGFTLSESVPVFMEIYVGYARYDPRAVFAGEDARRLPLRWNNLTGTIGIGYDIPLVQNLWLRPVLNLSAGYAASDLNLFADWVEWRTGIDVPLLSGQHVGVLGHGGSLMLAYYDFLPEREIDIELRYTHLRLETVGDTLPIARGSSVAQTLGLWGRYRWPTGAEAFGRPIRWVLDGSATTYFGDQREAIGFSWSAKFGGGIEFDTGRWELGAFGLNLNRVRLVGRYFIGDNGANGYSLGIGMTF